LLFAHLEQVDPPAAAHLARMLAQGQGDTG
jgi:hypothetical protein